MTKLHSWTNLRNEDDSLDDIHDHKICIKTFKSNRGEQYFDSMVYPPSYLEKLSDKEKANFIEIPVTLIKKGKCPIDGRKNMPVYIRINGIITLAVSDCQGHAYKVYEDEHSNPYSVYSSVCKLHNIYDPDDYEFERGLSGFDF